MNAFFIKNRLHDYIDGNLSPETMEEIDKAIVEHPELLAELEDLQTQRNLLMDHGVIKAPSELADTIWSHLENETPPAANNSSHNTMWKVWTGTLAAILLGWWFIPQNTTQEQRQAQMIKSAQSIPSINAISLPKNSPIEFAEANKSTEEPVIPVDDEPEVVTETEETNVPVSNGTPHTQTFIIQTPDTPYFAEHEQDVHLIELEDEHDHIHDDAYFAFNFAPANILFRLDELVTRHNGKMLTKDGVKQEPVTLSAINSKVSLEIHIPVSKVSTATDELRQIGGRFSGESIDEINGHGVYNIHITYQDY